MSNFEYIESAIIFGLDNKTNLRSFKHVGKDFASHDGAYAFVVSYFDRYGEFPSPELLCENFPKLDKAAQSVQFEYAAEQFKDQVLQRKVINAIQSQKDMVKENPKKALSNIMVNLTDIEVVYDEDVKQYDTGSLTRLYEWKERTKKRKMGDGLMGVPTSFKSINDAGVGWMPGELVSMFARPTIGKTWMLVHAAATAVHKGFKTLMISTEMPSVAINMRMDVVLAKMMGYELSHTALRKGDEIEKDKYEAFLKAANTKSLLVCDHIAGQVGISTEAINSLVRKHNPELVVIDGVYLISTGDKRQAIWEQSHSLFYGLKNLATATNTPIVVSTQATREAANMYTPPRADQVAFGDALIRASDVAISMCQLENEDDKRVVQFQKYRDGKLAKEMTVMNWEVNNGDIKELPDYYNFQHEQSDF